MVGGARRCGLGRRLCAVDASEFPPHYGLDHEFEVGTDEFLDTMAGAAGVPFSRGNSLELLNNGDEFYPAMLEAIRGRNASITIEAYIYWAGEIGLTFARALAGAGAARRAR